MRMTPPEVRGLYRKLGWNRIVGFHTTNTIHRPEFEMAIRAMQKSRANLLLLPGVGVTGREISTITRGYAVTGMRLATFHRNQRS